MIRKKNFILVILFFAFLQVCVLHYFRIFSAKPDLFLICAMAASIYFEVESALILSLLCGILKDVFSVTSFGLNTFLLPVFSFLVIKLSRRISLADTPVICAVVFLTAFSYAITYRLILGYLGATIPFWTFLRISFCESLYTASVLPLTFRLIRKTLYL
jgi:rod shape-determining protein MreD